MVLFSNNTNWSFAEVNSYELAYELYLSTADKVNFFKSLITTILSVVGFVGYTFELLTLSENEFLKRPSFLYHIILALCEIFLMIICSLGSINGFMSPDDRSYFSVYTDTIASLSLSNSLVVIIHFVILGMTVDRFVAVNLPMRFQFFNVNKIVLMFFLVGFINGLGPLVYFFVYNVELNSITKNFQRVKSDLYGIVFSPVYFLVIGLEMIKLLICLTLSIAICIGFIKGSKSAGHKAFVKSKQAKEEKSKKENRQLTILCLSCSLPFIITLFMKFPQVFITSYVVGTTALDLEYSNSLKNLNLAYKDIYYSIAVDCFYMIVHSSHFYIYLLLNDSIRKSAVKRLASIKQTDILSSLFS